MWEEMSRFPGDPFEWGGTGQRQVLEKRQMWVNISVLCATIIFFCVNRLQLQLCKNSPAIQWHLQKFMWGYEILLNLNVCVQILDYCVLCAWLQKIIFNGFRRIFRGKGLGSVQKSSKSAELNSDSVSAMNDFLGPWVHAYQWEMERGIWRYYSYG